jgi:hypothetical protein
MLRVLLFVVPIALAIYALVDLVQTRDEDVQGLPKLAWVALIVLIWVVGPVAWLVAGKRGRRWLPGLSPRPAGPSGGAPGRPIAPDDDPDFLRGLGRPKPPPPRDDDGDDPPHASR